MTLKTALVTGASAGLGAALATKLAEKGYRLILAGRNAEHLSEVSKNFKTEVIAITGDLLETQDRKKIIELIHEHVPELIINNAGFGLYGEAINHSTQAQIDLLRLNTEVPLEIILEASKALLAKNRKGTILNVSSVSGFYLFPQFAVYAASKHCVVDYSKSLDLELAARGVRVLVACPGMIATTFSHRAAQKPVSPQKGAMTVQEAADHIWWQIEHGKQCYIFNWKYRWGTYLSRLFPSRWVAAILARNIRNRLEEF